MDDATHMVYVGDLCTESRTNDCFKNGDFGHMVSVIDGASNTVVDHVAVGTAPFGPAADSERNIVYVPNLFDNTVSVIDGTTDSVIDSVPVGALPAGAGVNTSTNRVYVSNLGDNTVFQPYFTAASLCRIATLSGSIANARRKKPCASALSALFCR